MIKIKNLSKSYGKVEVLKDINLELGAGEIIGIIGPNSSGKSTLLKIISGLVKTDVGKVEIFGKKLNSEIKEKIAFLPEINHLYSWMKVKDLINFFGTQFDTFNKGKAEELIKHMKIKKDVCIKKMSKGMLGRVKLVLALSREVPLIILDEPLSGLDIQSRHKILDTLLNEYQYEKQTILIATHELLEIEHIFDSVVFIKAGKIELQDSMDELRMKYKMKLADIVEEVLSEKDSSDN